MRTEVGLHPGHVAEAPLEGAAGRLDPHPLGQGADRGETHPLVVELAGDEAPALVPLPDEGGARHPDVVVVRGGRGHPADGDQRGAGEPRRRGGHEEDRDALVLGGVGVGPGGQPDVVGLVGAAGEDLVAVDDPLVTVEHGPGAQRGEVGARTRLGVADGEVDLAGQDAREEEALLLVGAEAHEHGTDGVEGHERERCPGPLHLGEEDELVGGGPALPAVLLRPADPEPAVLSHPAHQGAEDLAPLLLAVQRPADVGRQHVGEVGPQLVPQGQLLRGLLEMHGSASLHCLRRTRRSSGACRHSPAPPVPGPGPVRLAYDN